MLFKITDKTISTVLVLLNLIFVLVFHSKLSFVRASVIFVSVIWIVIRILLKKKLTIPTLRHGVCALCFFAMVVLSAKWHLYPRAVEDVKNNVMWSMIISVIIVDYITTYKVSIADFTKLFVPVAVLYIATTLVNGEITDERLSIGINANTFGKIGINLAWLFLFNCYKSKWKKTGWIVLFVLVTLCSLLSGSRKAIISLVIFAMAYMLFEYPNRNAVKLFGKIFSSIIVLIIGYIVIINVDVLYNTIGNRIEAFILYFVFGGDGDASILARESMRVSAINLFKQYPIVGAGVNAFTYRYDYGAYSHCGYTEILSGLGIVGFCVYYYPVVGAFVTVFKMWKERVEGAIVPLCFLVVFFVNEWGKVSYFSMSDHLFLGIAIGFVYVLRSERRWEKLEYENYKNYKNY